MVSCLSQSLSPDPQPPAPESRVSPAAGRTISPSQRQGGCASWIWFPGAAAVCHARQPPAPTIRHAMTANGARRFPPRKISSGSVRNPSVARRREEEKRAIDPARYTVDSGCTGGDHRARLSAAWGRSGKPQSSRCDLPFRTGCRVPAGRARRRPDRHRSLAPFPPDRPSPVRPRSRREGAVARSSARAFPVGLRGYTVASPAQGPSGW